MEKVKIIAFYLPQYHSIPENNEWWGEGFTEWTTLKKGKPLFEGHYQPRIPLNNNYYCLLDESIQEWQSKIAQDHGIYGFCYYHYWFNGHLLLEKPMEAMLKNKRITIPFCVCWANEDWTNQWVSNQNKVLIAQKYGDQKEWEAHYKYLEQFFLDDRYIKEDNSPLVIIYRPELVYDLEKMIECWKKLAVKSGFNGLKIAYQNQLYKYSKSYSPKLFDYQIEYQPQSAILQMNNSFKLLRTIKRKISLFLEKHFHFNKSLNSKIKIFDYKSAWETIIHKKPKYDNEVAGGFVGWDNTPRKQNRGFVFEGQTPELFEHYLKLQIKNIKENYHNNYLFMFAWNEWTEGGYLEPDEKYGYSYLEAIKRSVNEE